MIEGNIIKGFVIDSPVIVGAIALFDSKTAGVYKSLNINHLLFDLVEQIPL